MRTTVYARVLVPPNLYVTYIGHPVGEPGRQSTCEARPSARHAPLSRVRGSGRRVGLHRIFFHCEALHSSIIYVLPPTICIAHTGAIPLHDYCETYDLPRPSFRMPYTTQYWHRQYHGKANRRGRARTRRLRAEDNTFEDGLGLGIIHYCRLGDLQCVVCGEGGRARSRATIPSTIIRAVPLGSVSVNTSHSHPS